MSMTHPRGEEFVRHGYTVARPMVGKALCSFLYGYVGRLLDSGSLPTTDEQVPNAPGCYADPLMEALLESLIPSVGELTGIDVQPTYSYFRVYRHGDVLRKHYDRSACEVSVSLTLGGGQGPAWPIWIDSRGGPQAISLEPGDALLYRGIELAHWRERFEGERVAQVFLHYVDAQGPCREWIYNKRESLRTSVAARHLVRQFGANAVVGR
jgi:hypothetical protein